MVDKSLVLRKLIDAEIIVAILKKNLNDFIKFKDAILVFLESEK
jgi:hypothetical protein